MIDVGAVRAIILEKESVDAGEDTISGSFTNLAAAASAKSGGIAGGIAASVLIWPPVPVPVPALDELPRLFPLEGEEKDGLRPKEGLRSRSLVKTLDSLSLSLSLSPELVPGRDLLELRPPWLDCDCALGIELALLFPQILVEKKGVAFCVGVEAADLCMVDRA